MIKESAQARLDTPIVSGFGSGYRAGRLFIWLVAGWVVVVSLTPIDALRWLGVEAVVLSFLIGAAGVLPGRLWQRWRGLFVTLVFLSGFVAIGHPKREVVGWLVLVLGILMKNAILFGTVAGLSERFGQVAILNAMARFGLPRELVSTISFMARYGPLLRDQTYRMKRARQSRMIRGSLPGVWLIQSGGLSTLLANTLERSQRIHAAMLSRGWQSGEHQIQSKVVNQTGRAE